MRIEIVTIGEEILRGQTPNTNASWISAALFREGASIFRHSTLPDDQKALKEGIQEALMRSDLVILTGGLGPTCDDLTKAVVTDVLGGKLQFQPKVAEDLQRRFGKELKSLVDQATQPENALLLPNPLGTACGLLFTEKGKIVIALPGVPLEMETIFTQSVLPYLKEHVLKTKQHAALLHFSMLYENQVDPLLRQIESNLPEIALGIYPSYGTLSVSIRAQNLKDLESAKEQLLREFGSYQFVAHDGKIASALQAKMIQEKKTLALAESCTGGMLAATITEISGASEYFLGSIVSYCNAWKKNLLGVEDKTLVSVGAVSSQTVVEMLEGVFKISSADYGIAVSGIAGPEGGTVDKPVGTVFAAIGKRGERPDVGVLHFKGTRKTRILTASSYLLGALLRKMEHGIKAFE